MRPKSMFLIVIALGCGLVASIGISQVVKQDPKETGATVETDKIFVAMTAIDIGEKLDAQNVRLEEWPKDRVPEGAITKLDELEERFPRQRLYAGEPILRAKLMDSLESDSVKIPEGYRVASVKVTMDTSVSGLVRPGDRVDVLVFLRKTGEVLQTGVRTILSDVRVFAVNQETERAVDKDGVPSSAKTVSLLVTPQQVERLMLAGQLGTLQLSLRRPDDQDVEKAGGMTVSQLLGQAPSSGEQPEAEPQPSSFTSWLGNQAAQTPAVTEPAAVEVASTAWKMVIHSPEGRVQYRWTDPNELPQQVVLDGAAPAAVGPQPAADVIAPEAKPADVPVEGTDSPVDGMTFEQ